MHQTLGDVPTRELYMQNIKEKMADPEFIGDTIALIHPEENWDAAYAFKLLKDKILDKF